MSQARFATIILSSMGFILGVFTESQADISGTYNVATLTPLERPEAFGNNLYLSKEEAERITAEAAAFDERASASSDPDRSAPKLR